MDICCLQGILDLQKVKHTNFLLEANPVYSVFFLLNLVMLLF